MESSLPLIDLIYASVNDVSGWKTFLSALLSAVRGTRASIALRDPDCGEITFVCLHGWPDEVVGLYQSLYAADDPLNQAILSSHYPDGTVIADFEILPHEEREKSIAYREFYVLHDAVHGLGGIIMSAAGGQSSINLVRGAEAGPFGETEKAVLRPLMPHLKRAASLHGLLGSMRAQLATFTGHLDRYPLPLFLINSDGRVLHASAPAREFAARRDGLSIENGRLLLGSATLHRRLVKAIESFGQSRTGDVYRLELLRPSGKRPCRLVAFPAMDSGTVPLGVPRPTAAILIFDPESRPRTDSAMLCEMFSLTPAEARVASCLAQGRSVEETAAETGAATGTIRTHLKRIFSKTATSRQGELIALVFGAAPFALRKN